MLRWFFKSFRYPQVVFPTVILTALLMGWTDGTPSERKEREHDDKAEKKERGKGGNERPDPAPIRVSDVEVDAGGGTPKGWTFRLRPGDAHEGRELFITLGCQQCHLVKGEKFPEADRGPGDVGPELTRIGTEPHPAEYLAEHIVNPNRVILTGEGFSGKDGMSVMPGYAHVLKVEDLADLVAYLQSLKGEGENQRLRHLEDDDD
jgi:mono/diheme cytochrome c family protein